MVTPRLAGGRRGRQGFRASRIKYSSCWSNKTEPGAGRTRKEDFKMKLGGFNGSETCAAKKKPERSNAGKKKKPERNNAGKRQKNEWRMHAFENETSNNGFKLIESSAESLRSSGPVLAPCLKLELSGGRRQVNQ